MASLQYSLKTSSLTGCICPGVQHRQEIGGDICLTTLKTKETFVL